MQKWKYAENYGGNDYSDYYVVIGRNRDSCLRTNHNYEEVWERLNDVQDELEEEDNTEYGWLIGANFGHWAVGWIELILVHESAPQMLIDSAEDIIYDLDQYPILNEDEYYRKVYEAADEYWRQMSLRERIEMCKEHDVNIFAARHDYIPDDEELAYALEMIVEE